MTRHPEQGDLVWVDFDPRTGREQSGRRPAIVMSPGSYNENSFTCIVCPITSNLSPWPFKVMLPEGLPVTGAILADQIKSIDRQARGLVIVGRAPAEIITAVSNMLQALPVTP